MGDRPIIFSAPMVRALLDGRKTQTRRLATSPLRRCEVGDRLWVRESFFIMSDDYGWENYVSRQFCQPDRTIGYRADGSDGPMVDARDWSPPRNAKRVVHGLKGDDHTEAWTQIGDIPCIYMPRWASRLTLIVEAVRLQPLLDISEEDAIAEGCQAGQLNDGFGPRDFGGGWTIESPGTFCSAAGAYQILWQSLHPEWDGYDSPDVVALTFRVVKTNIDQLSA